MRTLLTVLWGSMSGLSKAMVMQLRKMKTRTTWSKSLCAMTFWQLARNLEGKTQGRLGFPHGPGGWTGWPQRDRSMVLSGSSHGPYFVEGSSLSKQGSGENSRLLRNKRWWVYRSGTGSSQRWGYGWPYFGVNILCPSQLLFQILATKPGPVAPPVPAQQHPVP